jgi:uncharacterized protein
MHKFIASIALVTICFWPIVSLSDVFINEIHYDNAGTDAGEAIEIAGLAGTDLTGWSLVLYNGTGGVLYNTTPLSGVIPNQAKGYGTLVFPYPVNGIQNGAPDGIALVDPSSNVIQFLSYEGSFVAVGGPANGMQSTDIIVFEDGAGPVGYSLQNTGLNASSPWSGPITNTFGALNLAQTTGGKTSGIDTLLLLSD